MDSLKHETTRLKQLFLARLFGSLLFLSLLSWSGSASNQEELIFLQKVFFLWLILSIIQALIFKFQYVIVGNLLFQLISDILLISLLVFNSGGITSPVIFLLGVMIIIAGTQARVLVVLVIAVFSSIGYLGAIYTFASTHSQDISHKDTLHILLQISLFFLAGGIMAMIARRHAKLNYEKQQSTSQHQRLQEIHAQVLSSMQEGIVILDETLLIQDFNFSTSSMLDITHQDIGKNIQTFLQIPIAMKSFIDKNDLNVFRTESSYQDQCLLLTLTRLTDEHVSWLMTIVDITETRKLEKQLAEQDKLASIGQMAAMLAHEIRNPMQTIAQAVELMGLEQKNNKLEHIVTDELSRLNRLVSDMLDYASPLHPHIQHVDIEKLIGTSIDQIDLKNQFDIQYHSPKVNINIDPDHFRLVLDNLLRNAVRASPKPASIQVTFADEEHRWQLSVRDHGDGIDETMQNNLFDPFRTGSKQGTGLGLATVWQVCHVNQWTISINKNIKDGACFVIDSPIHSNLNHGEKNG